MRNIISLCSLLTMVLAACAPRPTIAPTLTISAAPTRLNSTITPTPKPSASIIVSATASETPSQSAKPFTMSSKISPNGEYSAYAYLYQETGQQAIEIRNKQDKLIWRIPYQGESPQNSPITTIGIHRWSNDSSQLYFCYAWSPDGGDIFVKESCQGLQKIDINSGEIQPVLPEGYVVFAISVDESQIAYIRCQNEPCVIHIRNLSTGLEKTAYVIFKSKNYIAVGNMEWSPNGNGLAFVTQDNDHMVQTIYLDPNTMKQKVMKENPTFDFSGWAYFQGWADNDTLEFVEAGNTDNETQIIHVDVKNKETILVGTPTPGA